MGIMEIIGIAGSVSLLAGWRLYLCIFATGLAMRFDVLPLPEHLASLGVLENPWSRILGLAPGRTLEALRDAHTQGLLDLLVAGNVVDVSFPTFGGVA